ACRSAPDPNESRLSLQCTRSMRPVMALIRSTGLRKRFGDVPLVQGGRSNGARVACRTAEAAGAAGVVALAFPLHPPGRPEKTRVEELRSAGVEVVVVNGDRDPFGVPGPADAAQVAVLPGERHDLGKDPAAVGRAVEPWLKRWAARPVRTGRR
ncbi:alpha/beta family hydrolase, partial [Actinomadura sp. NPDC049753]|uniref:alpha/beta family hydrolase n=1 Tax=Actinomadura sp. NPDC049753 TaxID=3154739 RepID=UPI00341EADA4